MSLERLYLGRNQITDEGCAALASALRGGVLPALRAPDEHAWGGSYFVGANDLAGAKADVLAALRERGTEASV